MTDTILVSLHLLGLAGLAAGLFASVRNRRYSRTPRARTVPFVVGALLAAGSVFVSYPLDNSHRIIGFPFMAAVFEKRGAHWEDFVGPLTLPAYLGNALFAFVLPQMIVLAWRWRARRAVEAVGRASS